jgi:hypothetical protein
MLAVLAVVVGGLVRVDTGLVEGDVDESSAEMHVEAEGVGNGAVQLRVEGAEGLLGARRESGVALNEVRKSDAMRTQPRWPWDGGGGQGAEGGPAAGGAGTEDGKVRGTGSMVEPGMEPQGIRMGWVDAARLSRVTAMTAAMAAALAASARSVVEVTRALAAVWATYGAWRATAAVATVVAECA